MGKHLKAFGMANFLLVCAAAEPSERRGWGGAEQPRWISFVLTCGCCVVGAAWSRLVYLLSSVQGLHGSRNHIFHGIQQPCSVEVNTRHSSCCSSFPTSEQGSVAVRSESGRSTEVLVTGPVQPHDPSGAGGAAGDLPCPLPLAPLLLHPTFQLHSKLLTTNHLSYMHHDVQHSWDVISGDEGDLTTFRCHPDKR